ncbi:MAG: ATP-dependent DNA helicase PcrA [Chlamydiae bacterium]|nr:ATP-dependent DNA helicase PcrA [Chlamydiota bacterium]
MIHYQNDLNDQQLLALQKMDGPHLVLAGAGSGKTRVVIYRILYMLEQNIPDSHICALTFTNKAAGEMKERLYHLSNQYILVSTFHALGAKILRESIHELGFDPNFVIFDDKESERLIKACMKEKKIDEKHLSLKKIIFAISEAKNTMVAPQDYLIEEKEDELIQQVYALYQERLKKYNGVDFDDLLYLPNVLFQEHKDILEQYQQRWRYLLIDEYQDTNHAQYLLARQLISQTHNLFVVGDPDQSIYSWRGADISNILSFEKDYPGACVIRLEQNYRSTQNILNAANFLIQENASRYEKTLWSGLGEGEKVTMHAVLTDRDEANFILERVQFRHRAQIPYKHMCVFYRTNAQSRALEDACIDHGVPYVLIGAISFYARMEIKDVLAYLRLLVNEDDFPSFQRVVKSFKLGVGPTTLEKFQALFNQSNMSLIALITAVLKEPQTFSIRLNETQKRGLNHLLSTIQKLKTLLNEKLVSEIIQETIIETNYLNILRQDPETFEDRKDNLDALIARALDFESNQTISLQSFLNDISLNMTTEEHETDTNKVHLMTLHNGKGLEFQVVFIAGLEEDLLPHINAKLEDNDLEEERRLCYVGMTRAKEHLYLTYCKRRFLWGGFRSMTPSRFLSEIPQQYIQSPQTLRKLSASFELPKEPTFAFQENDQVMHKEFGLGRIESVYEGSFGTMYDVYFEHLGSIKTLVAKFAPLTKT